MIFNMNELVFLPIAFELEDAGLLWHPEIGDEVAQRENPDEVSILVDNKFYKINDLREMFVWLPRVEQLVKQIELRQAILAHAGLELTTKTMHYKAILKAPCGEIQGTDQSLRGAVGKSLRDFLIVDSRVLH